MLVFATAISPLLHFALVSGFMVLLLTLLLLFGIIGLRIAGDRRTQRQDELIAKWQPVFLHAIEGLPVALPVIHEDESQVILSHWIYYSEMLRGEARERLKTLAHRLNLIETALRLLKHQDVREQLLAIISLGRMQAVEAWTTLGKLTEDPNPTLSLLAARSLLQIDTARASPMVLSIVGRRSDWSPSRVAAMLADAPRDILAPHLDDTIAHAAPSEIPRLVALLDIVQIGDRWPVLEPLLDSRQPADIIIAALKSCHDPRALEAVRRLAIHPEWEVRAKVAGTLGRIGSEEDMYRLQALLCDTEWWVRYRAAVALLNLPTMSRQKIAVLLQRLDDPFAASMLHHVLAETDREPAT